MLRHVRGLAAIACLVLAGLLLATPAGATEAGGPPGEIVSPGPLTRIITSPDLDCQVAHAADLAFEFFAGELGACATLLAFGGALYGPASIPSGGGADPRTPWTPVSRSSASGSGRQGDPWVVVTVVDAGTSGVRVEQRDEYIAGEESYRTEIRIANGGAAAVDGILYRAGDCYLQDSDIGFGRVDDRAPACVISTASDARIEQWIPETPGSRYIEAGYSEVWAAVGSQQPFPDTCRCDEQVDNGAGLSWTVTIPAGASTVVAHRTFFSPEGRRAATTSLPDSVPGPLDISLDPVVVAQSAAVAAGVVALVPFPAALFNSTLEQHYGEVMAAVARFRAALASLMAGVLTRIRGWLATRRRREASGPQAPDDPLPSAPVATSGPAPSPEADQVGRLWRTPAGIALFLLASALLYSLLDPTVGLDLDSLATVLGLLAGLAGVVAAWIVPTWLLARRSGAGVVVRALPATLAIAVGCVLLSRIADFQPGYLYGLVVGALFSRELGTAGEARIAAGAAGTGLAGALLAWLLLPLVRAGGGPDAAFGAAVAETAFVTMVVAGLEGAVFAMLPLRFLPGERVRAWDRRVWAALLGLGTFGFGHILLHPSSGYLADTTRTSFLTVVGLLVTFGLASVAFWAWFRFRPSPRAAPTT
jgi:hypothetical protein